MLVGDGVGEGVTVGVDVGDVGVWVGVDVGAGVCVGVDVGVAIRLEIAPHPVNPGRSNKESNKMPAFKNTLFFILASFGGYQPPNGAAVELRAAEAR